MKKAFFGLLMFLLSTFIQAQEPPIEVGQWRTHFSSKSGNCIAIDPDENRVWIGSDNILMDYDLLDGSIASMDKVNGLNDINITQIYYATDAKKLFLFYENGNLDILENGNVTNFPFIKNSTAIGSKKVQDILRRGDYIYAAAGVGIMVIDVYAEEVKETYTVTSSGEPNVNAIRILGDSIYAATTSGLYSAYLEDNLNNFFNWKKISDIHTPILEILDSKLWLAQDSTLYTYDQVKVDSINKLPSGNIPTASDEDDGMIYWTMMNSSSGGSLYTISSSGVITQKTVNFPLQRPVQIIRYMGQSFIADDWIGLVVLQEDGSASEHRSNGPNSNNFFDLTFDKEKMYCTSGGVNTAFNGLGIRDGLKIYQDGWWQEYTQGTHAYLDSFTDMMPVVSDPRNGSLYIGSWGGGLLELKSDGSHEIYKGEQFTTMFGGARIVDMELDREGNLWLINFGGNMKGIACKTKAGDFINLNYNRGIGLSDIAIDQSGQLWVLTAKNGGLTCYDPAGTIADQSDDRRSQLVTGMEGSPQCIAVDLDGELWIGTTDGMALISCPDYFINGDCELTLPVVNFDSVINAYLFDEESIRAIAVDGANRKWVGSENGVWLISENADQILLQFDESNSPLPSNKINKISINPYNGEVFFVTENGLVSYRGNATAPVNNEDVEILVFPNPVPPGHQGNIGIRNLPEEADVRITDAAGQLVYRTSSLGGQANWDGHLYTGERASSGVYFIHIISTKQDIKRMAKLILLD